MIDPRKQTGVAFSEDAHKESDPPARTLLRRIVNEDGFHPPAQAFFRERFGIIWVQDGSQYGIDFDCYSDTGHGPLWQLDVKHKRPWERDDQDFPWDDVQIEPRSTPHIGPRTLFLLFSRNWKRAVLVPPDAFTGRTREVPNARDDLAEFPLASAARCYFFILDPPGPVTLGPDRLREAWRQPEDVSDLLAT